MKKLRNKFIKDNNFPIQVLESPYFEYFLDLYEPTLQTRTAWGSLLKELPDGRPGKWLECSRETQENLIKDMVSSEAYMDFCESTELYSLMETAPGEIGKELYTGEQRGKKFLSIDLREANFQALRWVNPEIVKGKETWEEFMSLYTDLQSLKHSKVLRQILLGRTNPKRIIKVQKYLMWRITEIVSKMLPSEFKLFSRVTDEVIWEIPKEYTTDGILEEDLKKTVKEELGIEIKVSIFTLEVIQRFTHMGNSVLGFIKDFAYPSGKASDLKGVPRIWYPQMYKAWKELALDPVYDLVFIAEGELARFDYPLTIINPNDKAKNNSDRL